MPQCSSCRHGTSQWLCSPPPMSFSCLGGRDSTSSPPSTWTWEAQLVTDLACRGTGQQPQGLRRLSVPSPASRANRCALNMKGPACHKPCMPGDRPAAPGLEATQRPFTATRTNLIEGQAASAEACDCQRQVDRRPKLQLHIRVQTPYLQLGVADHGLGQHIQQGHCRRPGVLATGEGSLYMGHEEVAEAEGGHAEHCKLPQQICDVVANRGSAAAPPGYREDTTAEGRQ